MSMSLPNEIMNRDRSFYAGLERGIPTLYRDDLVFNGPNRSPAMWHGHPGPLIQALWFCPTTGLKVRHSVGSKLAVR